MIKQTFEQIRKMYPDQFLLLLNYEGKDLPDGRVDIIAAEEVQVFQNGEQMMEAFKRCKGSNKKIMFCTPEYKERLIVDRVPAMRVFG